MSDTAPRFRPDLQHPAWLVEAWTPINSQNPRSLDPSINTLQPRRNISTNSLLGFSQCVCFIPGYTSAAISLPVSTTHLPVMEPVYQDPNNIVRFSLTGPVLDVRANGTRWLITLGCQRDQIGPDTAKRLAFKYLTQEALVLHLQSKKNIDIRNILVLVTMSNCIFHTRIFRCGHFRTREIHMPPCDGTCIPTPDRYRTIRDSHRCPNCKHT
jgi:hypothetical protein